MTSSSLQSLKQEPDKLIEIILRQVAAVEELSKEIQELKKQNEELKQQIRDLNDRNNGLSSKVEELEKSAARQAAPFRIADKKRKTNPKQPGRPEGHPGAHRAIPDHVDQEIEVKLECCPHCQQAIEQCRAVVQYIEELPAIRPQVIKLTTYEGACAHCQKRVRSTHPLQVSLAEGAAGVQLGPNALGFAAELNKKHGLTMGRTCAVLRQLFGLGLSPGGLSQALARLARKLEPAYENLLARLRDGPYVHSDETSWWVGGPGHWLWVLADKQTTVYQVAQGRGRNILTQSLGTDYGGVLVSDCLSIYDGVNPRQQKCYSHHLKAISKALEHGPSEYLHQLKAMLKAAMVLKSLSADGLDVAEHRQALEQTAQKLLSQPRPGIEEKVRRRLHKQQDHLFTFLDHPLVEATNNLAERQLRPAVIARKLSCGNKTQRGAHTWQILASLAATCGQRLESFAQIVSQAAVLSPTR
jgi:transposase/cell division protein FtsB